MKEENTLLTEFHTRIPVPFPVHPSPSSRIRYVVRQTGIFSHTGPQITFFTFQIFLDIYSDGQCFVVRCSYRIDDIPESSLVITFFREDARLLLFFYIESTIFFFLFLPQKTEPFFFFFFWRNYVLGLCYIVIYFPA